MMRISCILLVASLLQVTATGYSQNTSVNIRAGNISLEQLFVEIEKQADVKFLYRYENVAGKTTRINAEQAPVSVVLDNALRPNELRYTLMDNNLIVVAPTSVRQGIAVTGTVTDNGEPMPGVNVVVKGTTVGVITDIDGKYTISVPDANAVLTFSFVGYATQEQAVGDQRMINVTLAEDTREIDEVVVIGYGTVRKRDLTGAVSTVKGDDLNVTAAASVGHALQGRAAGLSIMQNSAQPGGGLDILIRGAGSVNASNRPLYVVDGFPIATPEQPGSSESKDSRFDPGTQGVLNFLNPNDIASIEVLKDASATAIYGSRAANGVVLVTTKRGKEGKAVVAFNASYGIQKYSDTYDVLNLKEWMNERNISSWDLWLYNNRVYPYGTTILEDAIAAPIQGVHYIRPYTDAQVEAAGEGTDWLSLVTRDGKVTQYNLSLQGGSASSRYSTSLNYFDHEGIIKNSRMRRYTGRINFEHDISKYFKTSLSVIASRLNNDNTPLGGGEWEKSGLIRAAVQMGPHIEAQAADGSYPINPSLPTQPNPYSLLNNTDNSIMDRVLTNGSVTAEPIKNLLLKVNLGIDRIHQTRNLYEPKSTLHGGLTGGNAVMYESDNEQYLTEFTANYSFDLNTVHRFSALAGYSYEIFKSANHNLGNNKFKSDAFLWYDLNAGEGTKVVRSSGGEGYMASYFGRLNYTLLDKYLFTATLRADGSSVLAPGHKWSVFPSVAVGWNLAEENFMASAKNIFSMLKLRASYGETGNSEINTNAYMTYGMSPAWQRLDDSIIVGAFPSKLGNEALGWETTTELNFGLDVSVLKGNISASFEFYNRVISDLLASKPINAYHDISFVMANIGKTRSRGFEVTLNTRNITRPDFSWTSDFTFTIYKDKWLERAPDWKPAVYENERDPIRAIYARKATGILQAGEAIPVSQPTLRAGSLIMDDIDGYLRDGDGNPAVDANGRFLRTGAPDGIMDDADTRLIGSTDPGYFIGLANRMSYRGFDFNFNLYGMFDRIMQDPTRMAYGISTWNVAQYGYNTLRSVKDRWMPDNPSTTVPSSFGSDYGSGDFYYEKAWFIRLQNVSLGYTIPAKVLKNVLSSCRVHFDINNLLVITPYGGLDPETDAYPAAYPNARSYTFGIDLQF